MFHRVVCSLWASLACCTAFAEDSCVRERIFTDSFVVDTATGLYEGIYSWNCSPFLTPGSYPVMLDITQETGNWGVTGTISYAGEDMPIGGPRYCEATIGQYGAIDGNLPTTLDPRGRMINMSWSGVAGRVVGNDVAGVIGAGGLRGVTSNGDSVHVNGHLGCSGNTGPGGAMSLQRADTLDSAYIQPVDGVDCGPFGAKMLYLRNIHPTATAVVHVHHHWIYDNEQHDEYQRHVLLPSSLTSQQPDARDARMGCPIPGPTGQLFEWDVVRAFRPRQN